MGCPLFLPSLFPPSDKWTRRNKTKIYKSSKKKKKEVTRKETTRKEKNCASMMNQTKSAEKQSHISHCVLHLAKEKDKHISHFIQRITL